VTRAPVTARPSPPPGTAIRPDRRPAHPLHSLNSPKRITAHDAVAHDGAGRVTWTYATNAEPNQTKTRTQTGVEFLAAFAQHILPPRMVRIRFRGLWSTAHRRTKLDRVRAWLLDHPQTPPAVPPPSPPPAPTLLRANTTPTIDERRRCTACGRGTYKQLAGPCPRPSRHERRHLLNELRSHECAASPKEANTAV